MLFHHHALPAAPARSVVLGAAGFIGAALVRTLADAGAPYLALGRADLDLSAPDAADRLAALLRPDDAVIFISAKAPVKNPGMLVENLAMAAAVAAALSRQPVAHLVYVSSDAVYADKLAPIREDDPAEPPSLHGVMHLARERVLRDAAGGVKLAILRPTLVYGAGDPHNGYGPNRFLRQAQAGAPIPLFGNGEEMRDHIHVADVAEIARLVLWHGSTGVVTCATGRVVSFAWLARRAVAITGSASPIQSTPRVGAMHHGGYRAFDISALRNAFPDFALGTLEERFGAA